MIYEATKTIVSTPPKQNPPVPDKHGREPFHDPLLASVDNLSDRMPHDLMSREKMEAFAMAIGLTKVLRWKPRLVSRIPAASSALYRRPGYSANQLSSVSSRKTYQDPGCR